MSSRTPKTTSLLYAAAVSLLATGCPGPADPCSSGPCGGGACTPANGQAFCLCYPGYVLQDNVCVAIAMDGGVGDPCVPSPCSGGKQCAVVNGAASCACPAGQVEANGACTTPTACLPNPCTQPHMQTCAIVGAVARCSCDPGYQPVGSGCSATPVYDCTLQHTGGGADSNEPNECPALATSLTSSGAGSANSIFPAGDVDWLKLTGAPGHILEVVVSGSSIVLSLDAYGSDGVTALLANHRGERNPALRTTVPGTGPSGAVVFVRVAADSPTATGPYTVTVRDLGADDHSNSLTGATPLQAGAAFAGSIQYDGDVDWGTLATATGHTYRLDLNAATVSTVAVDVLSANGGSVLRTLQGSTSSFTVAPTGGLLSLRAKGVTATSAGAFSVQITDLGADDHGDDPATATPVLALGSAVAGSWERSGDVDMLSLQAQANHLYALSCSGASGCRVSVTTPSGTVLANNGASWTANVTFQPTAATTVYLQLTPYVAGGTGSYTWTLTDLGADDHGDSNATASALTLGQATAGTIGTSGDHDFFSFTTTAAHSYRVTCTSTASYLCVMVVKDGSGTTLGSTSYGYGSATSVSFATSTALAVYIDVSASSATGSYSLTLTDLGADDHGNTTATATTVGVPSTTGGNIQYSGDVDVLSFTATANTVYSISCTTSASYLCQLAVRDPAATSVGSSSYGGSTTVSFRARTAGTYTITLTSSYSGYTGAYSVDVATVTDDFGDTPSTATAVTVGASVPGNIQFNGDTDVMSFAATASHIYSVTCSSSSYYLCELTIRSSAGTTVASSSYGSSTSASFFVQTAGTFTVEVAPSSTGYTGTYTVLISDLGADDHGDTPATATSVAVGSTTSGNVQTSTDVDVLKFTTTTNRLYTVTCTTSASYLCVMTVRDSGGNTVTTTGYGSSTSAGFKAANAGPYSVEVKGYSSYGYTGAYTVSVVDSGADDHGDSPATGTTITSGASATSGNIQVRGDKDVFVWTATAGAVYRFTCTTSSYYLCQLAARDPSLTTIASASSNNSSMVTFKAPSSGTYSVEVSSYSSSTGAYAVLLTTLTDDYGDTPGAATSLTLGTTKTGNLDYAADVDYFAVGVTSGTTYTVTVAPSGTYTTVYDASLGTVTLSSGATFTATSTGTYYLKVSAYGSSTGPYSVLVQ